MKHKAATTSVGLLSNKSGIFLAALLPLIVAGVLLHSLPAYGVQILNRSLKLQNSEASAINTYSLSFEHETSTSIGSILVQFCANDPLIGQPCTPPSGFDLSGAVLAGQSGMVGFSIDPATTANELILTRTAVVNPAPITNTYVLDNVQNPDTAGSYFVRVETFASPDASGTSVDYGGIAFRINNGLSIQAEVPPFLLFCVGNTIQPYDCNTAAGNYVDFGTLSSTKTATGKTQALVATNAEYGYTVRVLGTTLTSGTNVVPGLAAPDISRIGVSQFGLNIRANTTPLFGTDPQGSGVASPTAGYGSPNYYKFISGDTIASSITSDAYRLYTVSYIANVSSGQAPGVYVSTLQYIALATF